MTEEKLYATWVDAGGETALHSFHGDGDRTFASPLADVLATLSIHSNADWQSQSQGELALNGALAITVAVWPSVSDEASLIYRDATGLMVELVIPAPVEALFLADGETVDPAYVASNIDPIVIPVISTSSGAPVTAFVGGLRRRRK